MCFRNALLGKRVLVIAFLLFMSCVMYIMVVLVWICCFSFPLDAWEGLEFVIVDFSLTFSSRKHAYINLTPINPTFM